LVTPFHKILSDHIQVKILRQGFGKAKGQ
jgi:hypothetical protein